jgi:SpoVK/Ycf46/Vps4 family AAA+-type ATPase
VAPRIGSSADAPGAQEKKPSIIFIDELDAVGMKRFDSELSGDREVQRTMLELLNQLDGFSATEGVKVCSFVLTAQHITRSTSCDPIASNQDACCDHVGSFFVFFAARRLSVAAETE